MSSPDWEPKYAITPAVARELVEIEAARAAVEAAPLPLSAQAELSRLARVKSTHYSTMIEGNRLTLQEAEEVVEGRRKRFAGRERDVAEVTNYWRAIARVEELAESRKPITEETVKRVHALVMHGPRSRPSPYRDGQNAIRDSVTGRMIYLPPEASDVPGLMGGLVSWIARSESEGVPAVLIAGLAHYQFVTIHPYYDGNGRTARLLSSLILHRNGYGLKGLLSVEEYHAGDLRAYYGALNVGEHHNYYFGRAQADLTSWVEYFVRTTSAVFAAVRAEVGKWVAGGVSMEHEEMRRLDRRARVVVGLFDRADTITSADIASALAISARMARVLASKWADDGLLVILDASRRGRRYGLAEPYSRLL